MINKSLKNLLYTDEERKGVKLKKIVLLTTLSSLLFANNLEILNKDKKEQRVLEKTILETNYENLKNDWISPINLGAGVSRSHSFSDEDDQFTKSISLGFTQSIYKSGGIEFTIQYAKDKLKSDLLSWETQNNTIYQSIYEIILNITKLNLEIEQSSYLLQNKEIELVLKKIQYEAGQTDITELNDAIMSKNTQYKTNINLQNSLKEQEYELAKYTDLKYQEIEILDFQKISKDEYLEQNIQLMYEESLVDVLNSSYEKLKSGYLPNISISSSIAHSNREDLTNDETTDGTSGSVSLNFSMPLYDFNKTTQVSKSKLEVLEQKVNIETIKHEIARDFDVTLTKVNTYEKYNEIIKDNLKLYDELISVNDASNKAGMTSSYDLEILQNTRKINKYDLAINNINIQQEYAKLYFNTKKGTK